MYGIKEIGVYIPETLISNFDKKEKFEMDDNFIIDKIGVKSVSLKDDNDNTSDLCVKAYKNLRSKIDINIENIDILLVVTQNPDFNLPHTSAIVHGKLDIKEQCACFDISLGCSGYVYGLSAITSFMEQNNYSKGLLFTCDPYSKVIDEDDKNTSLLFGDAATVTLIDSNPIFTLGKGNYGTIGKNNEFLICKDGVLSMNGREIFNFAAKYVPTDIRNLLEKNSINPESIDLFVFHQGSKLIIDTITKRLNLNRDKVVYDIEEYGNTVSSSIPIILANEIQSSEKKIILISGFGVGLSWSSNILFRRS